MVHCSGLTVNFDNNIAIPGWYCQPGIVFYDNILILDNYLYLCAENKTLHDYDSNKITCGTASRAQSHIR